MREEGLTEVLNPSEIFLEERSAGAAGSSVVASMEGTRPVLVEIQALISPRALGIRAGWQPGLIITASHC